MFSSKLLARLRNAYHIVGLIGPGLLLESSAIEALKGNNTAFTKLSSPSELLSDPHDFKMITKIRNDFKSLRPNLGHYSLVDLEKYFNEFDLISQNFDDLQYKAGSHRIIELHGNIMRDACPECKFKAEHDERKKTEHEVIKCPKCDSIMRPDILFRGESVNPKVLQEARAVSANCEVFIIIGSTGLIDPALSLPYIAKGNGCYLVEINSEATELSAQVDEFIKGESTKILPRLVTTLLDS